MNLWLAIEDTFVFWIDVSFKEQSNVIISHIRSDNN